VKSPVESHAQLHGGQQCSVVVMHWNVGAIAASLDRSATVSDWLGISSHPALLYEPRELLQWLCSDDSTINIVMDITNIAAYFNCICAKRVLLLTGVS